MREVFGEILENFIFNNLSYCPFIDILNIANAISRKV